MDILKLSIAFIFGASLFLNALLFVPQAIKLYRTKNAKDLSKITFVGFCFMQLSAVAYGIMNHDMILVIGYALSFCACLIVTVLLFKYSKHS